MKEMNSIDQLMETFLQSEWDKKELKKTVKRKKLIALLLKFKSLYLNQESLMKDVEHHLKELLKTISGLKEKEKAISPEEGRQR